MSEEPNRNNGKRKDPLVIKTTNRPGLLDRECLPRGLDMSGSMVPPALLHTPAADPVEVAGTESGTKTNEIIEVTRELPYDQLDLGVAFLKIAIERYGQRALARIRQKNFFAEPEPLSYVHVKTGVNEETLGLVGDVRIKSIPADFSLRSGYVSCRMGQDQQAHADELLDAVQMYLAKNSIYRGKAITVSREFLDLSAVSHDDVVYSEKVLEDLQANIWILIEQPDRCAERGGRLPRKVLLEGPYGTGKTLTALLTAQIATRHGYTFIYAPPTSKKPRGMFEFMMGDGGAPRLGFAISAAKLYAPAIVFVEDIDAEQRDDDDELRRTLEQFDGIATKGAKLLLIMTTNRVDRLAGGMARPGRVDHVVSMNLLDTRCVQLLIEKVIQPKFLAPDIDWSAVAAHCKDYTQAFVREMGIKAGLKSVVREQELVTQNDLFEAAQALQRQHAICRKSLGFEA